MENKRVLVIGAGSHSKRYLSIKGIGTCLVERLAREKNLSVLFTYYKSKDGARKLVKEMSLNYPDFDVNCLRFNSLNYKSEWKKLESQLKKFGTPHVFVYNSGLRFYKKSLSDSEKKATMKVNYTCPVFLVEKIGKKMHQKQIRGKIVLISSVLAEKHHPFLEDYCLTKSLLNQYVQKHKDYWKNKGIDIKIISPDVTRTPMTEERIDYYEEEAKGGKRPRIISPEEIAEEIITLCLKIK